MGAPSPPSTVTQTNKIELSPEQKKLYDLAFPFAEQYAGSNPQIYSGQTIANFSPTEQAGQQMMLGAAAPGAQLAGQAAGAQSQLLDPNFMLNPNQYVHAAADAATGRVTDNLQQRILPQLRTQNQVAGGQYSGGSTRGGIAEGLAVGQTNDALSRAIADMYLSNYNTGLGAMGQAIDRNKGVQSQMLFPGQVYSAVGASERGLEQAQLDEAAAKFYAEQDIPFSMASAIHSLADGMPGGGSTSTVRGATPQGNPLMQGLGAMSSVLGMFGGMPLGIGK